MSKLLNEKYDNIINKLKKILNEVVDSDESVITIDNKDIISNYIVDIFNIMVQSYESKGGFKTAKSPNHLLKSTDLVKIIFKNNEILACSTYRIFGGYKLTAIGCVQNEEGKKAIQKIIKDDIGNFKDWYWAEVSDAIEHYFKKYDGYPIPNIYASTIIKKEVDLLDDGVHYMRVVGVDSIPYVKAIYGFRDKNIYDMVMREVDDYDKFKQRINGMNEYADIYSKDVNKAITIIENIYTYHIEDGFNEMTPFWFKSIKFALSILNKFPQKDKMINKYIQMGNDLIDEMPLLKLNKF